LENIFAGTHLLLQQTNIKVKLCVSNRFYSLEILVNTCTLECHFLPRLLSVSNKNISVLETIKIVVKFFIEISTSVALY